MGIYGCMVALLFLRIIFSSRGMVGGVFFAGLLDFLDALDDMEG